MPWINNFASSGLDQQLVEMSLRAALILAVTWLVAAIAERLRSSAAARHLIWSLGLLGAVTLPLAMAGLPTWKITVKREGTGKTLPIAKEHPLTGADQETVLLALAETAVASATDENGSFTAPSIDDSTDAILPGERWLSGTGLTWMFVVCVDVCRLGSRCDRSFIAYGPRAGELVVAIDASQVDSRRSTFGCTCASKVAIGLHRQCAALAKQRAGDADDVGDLVAGDLAPQGGGAVVGGAVASCAAA
jgi:hypothetical protein